MLSALQRPLERLLDCGVITTIHYCVPLDLWMVALTRKLRRCYNLRQFNDLP
jgi:hypothetical protein